MDINKKIALIAAGSLLSVGGLYAMGTSANAAETPTAPAITSPIAGAEAQDATDTDNVQEGVQNAADDATESATEAADDANEGPDDANEGPDDATEGAEVAGK
jgi:uncharacterized protein YggE